MIVAEVGNVVRDGIARGGFRDAGDVRLAVELLSGVMRVGVEFTVTVTSDWAITVTTIGGVAAALIGVLAGSLLTSRANRMHWSRDKQIVMGFPENGDL
ncbi:hypothetical protein [Streptomyces phaeochromogenes]|uniref:hypothetical protein n=1 Tax=Streptomyces phaeochromogenes TaxID=1923 RepID=UPI0036CAA46C